MKAMTVERPSWKDVHDRHAPLLLPAAHDALTARLIERAGFPAYQIGGFAVAGTKHAVPDFDLEHYGEKSDVARQIINACSLPVLVDGDDGYGDVKNVTRTDAIEPHNLEDALRRGERYRKAGADGLYFEGPTKVEELERIGREFRGMPLAVSILEGGGKTPWVPPEKLHALGFTMILYPTSILFRATRAIELAIEELKAGRQLDMAQAVDMKKFEEIVDMPYWQQIEKRFRPQEEQKKAA